MGDQLLQLLDEKRSLVTIPSEILIIIDFEIVILKRLSWSSRWAEQLTENICVKNLK